MEDHVFFTTRDSVPAIGRAYLEMFQSQSIRKTLLWKTVCWNTLVVKILSSMVLVTRQLQWVAIFVPSLYMYHCYDNTHFVNSEVELSSEISCPHIFLKVCVCVCCVLCVCLFGLV